MRIKRNEFRLIQWMIVSLATVQYYMYIPYTIYVRLYMSTYSSQART